MTISLRASSAWAAGSTSVAPAIPTGTTTGDRMVLFVGTKPYNATIVCPTGWTPLTAGSGAHGSTANGVDTGSVLWGVFYKDWRSGDAAPTVSVTSGNVSLGTIHSYSKTAASWVTLPVAEKGSDTSSGTGFSLTMGSDVGITAGDMLATFAVIAGNNATFGTPTITATSATIGSVTEEPATEGTTTTGNDLEASASYASCTAGTATAAAVVGWTLSVAQTGGGCLVRLRESSATQTIISANTGADNSSFSATQMRELNPTTNYGSAVATNEFEIHTWGAIDRGHMLLTPTGLVTAVPAGANIVSAILQVWNASGTANYTVDMHRVIRAATSSGATWLTYDGTNLWTTSGALGSSDVDMTAVASATVDSVVGYRSWDVTSWVQSVVNGAVANQGLLGVRNPDNAADSTVHGFQPPGGTDHTRPRLVVLYTAPQKWSWTTAPPRNTLLRM